MLVNGMVMNSLEITDKFFY